MLRLAKARALVERRGFVTPGTSARWPKPFSRTGFCSPRRLARQGSARKTSFARHSRERPYRCENEELRGHRTRAHRPRRVLGVRLHPLAVVGLGLAAAGIFARLWARAADGSIEFERRLLAGERIEGDDLAVEIRARHRRRLLGGAILLRQHLGPLEQTARMQRSRTVIVFADLPRGRHRLAPLDVVLTDPLGLARIEQQVDEASSILIRPRIPVLTSIFSAHGAREAGAARSLLRRPTGFEIHAVRDYAPGEPLRAVHWPSTARRGRLMVKELDDAPRDDLAIVLDQDSDGVAGPVGHRASMLPVRAAGAIGTRAGVVEPEGRARRDGARNGGRTDPIGRARLGGGSRRARHCRACRWRPRRSGPALPIRRDHSGAEIVVVTGRPDRAVEPLLELRRGGRSVSLVILASETYAGRPRHAQQPAALRPVAQGVLVAVVSAETPIAEALAGRSAGVASG